MSRDPLDDPSFNAFQYMLCNRELLQPPCCDLESWFAWVIQNLPSMFDFNESLYWIRIRSPTMVFPHSKFFGKWMLFPKEEDFDNTWITVAVAMMHDLLGPRCKANNRVVIIYTYDFRDATDVLRVGLNLQRIFPARHLSYKPDVFTMSVDGIYGSNTIPKTIYTLVPGKRELTKTYCTSGLAAVDLAVTMLED